MIANLGPPSPPASQAYAPVLPVATTSLGSGVTIGQASPAPQLYGPQTAWPLAPSQVDSGSTHGSSTILWAALGVSTALALAVLGYFALRKNGWLRTPVPTGDKAQPAPQTANTARPTRAQPRVAKRALGSPQSSVQQNSKEPNPLPKKSSRMAPASSEQISSKRPEHAWTKSLQWKDMPSDVRDFISKERMNIENSGVDLWEKRMEMWRVLTLPASPATHNDYHGEIVDACFPLHSSSLKNRRDVEFSLIRNQHKLRVLISKQGDEAKKDEFDRLSLRLNIQDSFFLPKANEIDNITKNIRKRIKEQKQILAINSSNRTLEEKNNALCDFYRKENKLHSVSPKENDQSYKHNAGNYFSLKSH